MTNQRKLAILLLVLLFVVPSVCYGGYLYAITLSNALTSATVRITLTEFAEQFNSRMQHDGISISLEGGEWAEAPGYETRTARKLPVNCSDGSEIALYVETKNDRMNSFVLDISSFRTQTFVHAN